MMKTRHLGAALSNLISIKKTNQIKVAEKSGVSQPAINRIIQGARPTPETLKLITNAWEKKDGIALLIEHLRDEIERSGQLNDEINITPRDGDDYNTLADTLISAARIDHDVRALLIDLANLINRSQTLSIAAETGPDYKTKSKGKK
jgi:transcriptional regulator with XRE-family HTH domain